MTSTPRPLKKVDSIPPPLDLGEPGAPTTDESSPELRAAMSMSAAPVGPAQVGTLPTHRRNVAFKSQSGDEATVPSPRSPALEQLSSRPITGSPELRSSEEGHTDSSSKPLYPEAGPSQTRSNSRLKLSPKLTFSPRLDTASMRSPPSLTKSGPRSLRKF